MNGHELRQLIGAEEFDYQTLMSHLHNYRAPAQKINELLKAKVIIRVKKGLYIFGPQFSREAYSKKLLANWIYGPSYISLQSALSFYGLIPERVNSMMSVTCKRDKNFSTPVGDFTYRYLSLKKYPLGVSRVLIDPFRHVFMASPEKALIDTLTLTPRLVHGPHELDDLLFKDLRINQQELNKKINVAHLAKIARPYKYPSVDLLLTHFFQQIGVHSG